MVENVKKYDAQTLLRISKTFSNFLALANSAENHHRIRRLKESLLEEKSPYGLWPKEDSCAGSIRRLVSNDGVSAGQIMDALKSQKLEIVLTAHPTEVNRRTLLRKHRRVKSILEKLDNESSLSTFDKKKLETELKAEILSIWETDDLRRSKPSPVDEARSGLAIVEQVLWDAVPSFIRKLDDVVKGELKQSLPLDFAPVKIASWMGGDRDVSLYFLSHL